MFERSRSGQQNRASFLDADVTCYVEGGGGADTHAPDITFWRMIFAHFAPGIKVRCVPRGGKPVLEALARDIISKDLKNTVVAMDKDYDSLRGTLINDPRVFYTRGYSWENDAFCLENLANAYLGITHVISVADKVKNFIFTTTNSTLSAMRRGIAADYIALCGGSSVLPRQNPGRVISSGADGLPFVRNSELLKLCAAANKSTRPRNGRPPSMGQEPLHLACVGHVLAHIGILIVKAAIRKFHSARLPTPDHIRDIALQAVPRLLGAHLEVRREYAAQFARPWRA